MGKSNAMDHYSCRENAIAITYKSKVPAKSRRLHVA